MSGCPAGSFIPSDIALLRRSALFQTPPRGDRSPIRTPITGLTPSWLVSSICDMKQDGDQQEARNVLGKDALVRRIARALAISRKDARVILELILDSMVRALRSGGKVEIRRFGSF